MRILSVATFVAAFALGIPLAATAANPQVEIKTSMGTMVQGGGYTKDLDQKPTRPAIEHEGAACGSNDLGTIAMARTGDPHSATSQFFVNVVNNARLNYTLPPQGWGYCAFGRVVKGMDVAQKIVAVPNSPVREHQNLPKDPITIESVTLVTK